MTMPNTTENVAGMLSALEMPRKQLTPWELGYLESITAQFEERAFLSKRQLELLEQIYTDKA